MAPIPQFLYIYRPCRPAAMDEATPAANEAARRERNRRISHDFRRKFTGPTQARLSLHLRKWAAQIRLTSAHKP